ncbi:TolC family protein [Coprobacter tertius]|uniref:TolC family protein n=1 Tax=Coprobacter tertius TaxID=2944915 RepID=A0ABT1MKM3_9BACT|nr:TolC family protein [Coprobacter tertius]MCP9612944.1 TolC family protein [Coprobacter tertius]
MNKLIFYTVLFSFLSLPGIAQETAKKWTLDDCIDYALEQNIQLKKSKISYEESLVDTKEAKAQLFPSLSFSTSHNVVNRPYDQSGTNIVNVGGSGNYATSGGSNKTNYNGNYGVNASWTLFNGGKRLKTIEQQKLNNQIAELDIAQNANTIQESITQVYVQILYAAESVKTNENTLKLSEAQRDRGKELLAVGSIAQSDYAQLEAQCSTDKYQLVTAQATLKDYKLQLKQLLEIEGEEEMNLLIPELDTENVLSPLPSKTDVYQSALAFRPEIQSGKLNIEASELAINIAKKGYMPSLSLNAGIGTNNSSNQDYNFGKQLKYGLSNSVGLTLSIPIYNNRQTKSAVEKARLQSSNSELDLLNEQKTLFKTIETLWLDANSAQEQFVAANEKLHSTEISYNLINEQFNLGMKNTVDLLTEKNNMLAAQQELLQAKYMAILNRALLRFYQGEKINL